MVLRLPPDLEKRVAALAEVRGREPSTVLADLVGAALDDEAAYGAEVEAGLAELDGGDGIPHEEAMGRMRTAIERRFGPRTQ